jgi:nucleoside phosphorylase
MGKCMGLSKPSKQRVQGKSVVLVDSGISEYNVAVTMATAIETLEIIPH